MSIQILGVDGASVAKVDPNYNLAVSLANPPSVLGSYRTAGGPAGVIAAGLAANTNLMHLYNAGTNLVRLRSFTLSFSAATLGAAAGVAGSIGLLRTSVAAMTGGTARTPVAADTTQAATAVTVMDLASALTTTGVTIGGFFWSVRQALAVVDGNQFVAKYQPFAPDIIRPTQGIALATRVALAATETEVLEYQIEWDEVAA